MSVVAHSATTAAPSAPATPAHGIDLAALQRTLCDLGRVTNLRDLGTNGTLVASAGADSLFHCLFGRDSIRMAMDLLEESPGLLPVETGALRERAARLRARVLAEFWQPDLGTFAQALTVEPDGTTRPARVVASSPGHLLASRLLDGPDVAALRERLIARFAEADLLAGAGIRTKSTAAPRFRAGSYHNGSTWPMDTGVIADGLRRHGHHERADDLEERILRGCAAIGGFPEFLRGEEDGALRVNVETVDLLLDGVMNRLEQPPQASQGWTATRVWRILRRRGAVSPVDSL
ncbi:MAG TPA: hypothetical protein VHN78_12565 [Chloroflexota bacterium]|nr:hypothetical protein [Chloroflexota bacterium]